MVCNGRDGAGRSAEQANVEARMNSIALFVDYDGREVWRREVLPWNAIKAHKGTYTSFQFNQPGP